MPQYETGLYETVQAADQVSWSVGRGLLIALDLCGANDWPVSLRYQFELNPADLYGTVTVLV